MEQAVLKAHLALAERHVADGEEVIAKQLKLIAELKAKGLDTRTSEALLKEFEITQALHVGDRNRLRKELANAE